MKNKKIIFYSLLYFTDNDINPNLSSFYKKNKDKIYILNALNLNNSLAKQNLNYVLITNNKKKIENEIGSLIKIKQISFKKIFKKKISFLSAHYKVEVYNFLSKQKNISCLLDLDILALNKLPTYLKYAAKKKINLVYNLNKKKINKSLNKKIVQSLRLCNNLKDNSSDWFGGEFVFGSSKFFHYLYKNIRAILPNYKKHLSSMHHVGDETLLNAALQLIKKKKLISFNETNKKKIIGRFWSINTVSRQKNINYFLNNFLIHLPSDKVFLSEIDVKQLSVKEIKKIYLKYYNSPKKKFLNKIKKLISFR